jgi:hypothetical protein
MPDNEPRKSQVMVRFGREVSDEDLASLREYQDVIEVFQTGLGHHHHDDVVLSSGHGVLDASFQAPA